AGQFQLAVVEAVFLRRALDGQHLAALVAQDVGEAAEVQGDDQGADPLDLQELQLEQQGQGAEYDQVAQHVGGAPVASGAEAEVVGVQADQPVQRVDHPAHADHHHGQVEQAADVQRLLVVEVQHAEPHADGQRGEHQHGAEQLPGAQAAGEARGELADHDAPGEPPVQVEGVVVVEWQQEAVQVGEVVADQPGGGEEVADAALLAEEGGAPHVGDQADEQPAGADAEQTHVAQLGAGVHRQGDRQQHDQVEARLQLLAVAQLRQVPGQVLQQQEGGEGAGADDHQVVQQLDQRQLEEAHPWLDHAEV